MTVAEEVNTIVETGRFPLTFRGYSRFLILLIPLFFLGLGATVVYDFIAYSQERFIVVGLVLIVIGALILVFVWKRLCDTIRFENFETGLGRADNVRIAQEVLLEELEILQEPSSALEAGLVVAYTAPTPFSIGEEVSVVCTEGRILINSRPVIPITIVKDKVNIIRVKRGFSKRVGSAPCA